MNDDDKTPAQSPNARRVSSAEQYAIRPCPGCKGAEKPCTVCSGERYSNSPFTWANWELALAKL